MRFVAFVLLVLAALCVVARANDCIMSKCPHELDACINDATCAASLECSVACEDTACTQQCAHKASCNDAFKNMTACASQCLPEVHAQVLDLIAEEEAETLEDELLWASKSKCKFLKKAKCAVKVALAIKQCSHDIPCIIQKLKSCAKCFCSMVKCKGPCKNIC
ncbi:uncharacterized protein ACA1_115650 [Acanthamoeba castellanii str. Neff]|uniref:Acanthaporin domain-containing protein n=1 Tax=Acanthamoeba castellanii (strain ATCC 30010 / Neff) TaxID=1257118 RepID=L8H4P1_ACACF|nr:uncharacterized protein ACA1_115650 [Acanthamoeba castellanii str. Neff]ELR20125.1 hypothetical protein ACA1_115650 [Acanthamoeba castellanii str. Neff]